MLQKTFHDNLNQCCVTLQTEAKYVLVKEKDKLFRGSIAVKYVP